MLTTPQQRSRAAGFSLLEVLVSILVLSIGMLGAAGMFTRAMDYSIDTERRQMAATLASEFMETLRADAPRVLDDKGVPRSHLGGYAKAAGDDPGGSCDSASITPTNRLACWKQRAQELMPEIAAVDNFFRKHFVVAESSGVVAITVAWPVKKGQCLSEDLPDDTDYCTYTLKSKL